MYCSECDRLTAEYEHEDKVRIEAVSALAARVEAAPFGEYVRLRTAVDGAQLEAQVARLILEQHKRRHLKAN